MSKGVEFLYRSVVFKTTFNNRYLVLIDERSLSHEICTCDFGFEDDIEPLDNSSLERLK
ncbi:hypothetical protein [Nostoc favosum]|uniref:Uncharacterized protein n=1 Tax=Nostoc favosum CHAB5714 TaxID=2780399 RepID=A0ABS8I3E8_9NOSO|nr:hypothetical protein [Nostoc favosum]MCC5598705.1 hypothetical protein [Nostoc favosum CHAB5714]